MKPIQLGEMRVHKVHEMDSPVPLLGQLPGTTSDDLKRLMRCQTVPTTDKAMIRLLAEEEQIEATRLRVSSVLRAHAAASGGAAARSRHADLSSLDVRTLGGFLHPRYATVSHRSAVRRRQSCASRCVRKT